VTGALPLRLLPIQLGSPVAAPVSMKNELVQDLLAGWQH
jgi:hypothetical protein